MFYSATGELKKVDNYKLPNYCPKKNKQSKKKIIEGMSTDTVINHNITNLEVSNNTTLNRLLVHDKNKKKGDRVAQFSSNDDASVLIQATGGESYLEIANTNDSTGDKTNSWGIGANDDTKLHFSWGANGTMNKTDKMIIDNIGNVGIGTSYPSTKLHVNGDIKSETKICIGNTCFSENDLKKMLSGDSLAVAQSVAAESAVAQSAVAQSAVARSVPAQSAVAQSAVARSVPAQSVAARSVAA